jgi:hypothetical protein
VLKAYFPLGHSPAGFWWRQWHDGSDDQLDNARLMRMAGRFARRVKAWGQANDVPVIYCKARVTASWMSCHCHHRSALSAPAAST